MRLHWAGLRHEKVNHSKEFVNRAGYHTTTIECHWRFLKDELKQRWSHAPHDTHLLDDDARLEARPQNGNLFHRPQPQRHALNGVHEQHESVVRYLIGPDTFTAGLPELPIIVVQARQPDRSRDASRRRVHVGLPDRGDRAVTQVLRPTTVPYLSDLFPIISLNYSLDEIPTYYVILGNYL